MVRISEVFDARTLRSARRLPRAALSYHRSMLASGRRVAIAAVLAVLLTAAACSEGSSFTGAASDQQTTSSASAPPASSGAKPLEWQPCDDGFRCAELDVPLDYNDLTG